MDKTQTSAKRVRLSPQARKDQIIDAAMGLVLDEGVSAVTMERVAELAGVSKGLVYAYFPNVAGLLQAVYVREVQVLNRQHGKALKDVDNFEDMARITWQTSKAAMHRRHVLLNRLLAEPFVQQRIEAQVDQDRHSVISFLAGQITQHYEIPDDVAQLAVKLALHYDEGHPAAESTPKDTAGEVWAAMMVGAMKELERRSKNHAGG